MRIVCDNCGAKYQISDDKVRNKVFKIRCKKCSHVIVVRAGTEQSESGAAPAEGPRVASAPAPASLSAPSSAFDEGEAVWYVVINREQRGPLTRATVEDHVRAGDLEADSFVWAEGMADWVRLNALAEFAAFFSASPAISAVASGASASPFAAVAGSSSAYEPAPSFGRREEAEADEDLMMSNNQPDLAQPSVGGGLFGGAPSRDAGGGLFGRDEEVDDGHGGPRVSAKQLRGQRNENSVLFSLDSLAADLDDGPRHVHNTGGSEGSGLIDISALGGAPAPRGGLNDAFGGSAFAPVTAAPVGAGPMPPLVIKRSSGVGKIVAISAAAVLLVGGAIAGTVMVLKKDPVAPPAVVSGGPAATNPHSTVAVGEPAGSGAEPAKPEAPKPEEPPAKPVAAEDDDENAEAAEKPEAEAEAVAAATVKKASGGARAPAKRAPPKRAPSRRAVDPEDEPPPTVARRAPAASPPPRAPRPAPSRGGGSEVDDLLGGLDRGSRGGGSAPPPARGGQASSGSAEQAKALLPEKLGKEQILTVVKKNSGKINQCKGESPGGSGSVPVRVVIAPNGRVSSANVAGGEFKGTPLGRCIENKVSGFVFPQFSSRDPMSVVLPFAI